MAAVWRDKYAQSTNKGHNREQLLSTMPTMEVDKETCFNEVLNSFLLLTLCGSRMTQTIRIWPHMELGSKGWNFT